MKVPVDTSTAALIPKLSSLASSMTEPENVQRLFQVLQSLANDPERFSQFKANPDGFMSAQLGQKIPQGAHFHYVNENNEYFPKEGDAVTQLLEGKGQPGQPWTRLELRAGIGPMCLLSCGICDNNY